MNVKWEDVKEDYARKDAEIAALKMALEELMSIVNIHSRATDNHFAWAEMIVARAAVFESDKITTT